MITSSLSSTQPLTLSLLSSLHERWKAITPFKIIIYTYICAYLYYNSYDILRSMLANRIIANEDNNVNTINTSNSNRSNSTNNNKTNNVFGKIISFINKIKTLKDIGKISNNDNNNNVNDIKKYKMTISILKDNDSNNPPLPFILIMTSILALMIIIVASIIISHKRNKKNDRKASKLDYKISTKHIVNEIENIVPFSPPSSPLPLQSLPSITFRTPPQSPPTMLLSPKSEYKQQFQYISKLSDSIFELENEKRALTKSLEQLSQESVTYKNDCENLTKMINSLNYEKEKFQLLHIKETTHLNKLIERNRELLENKKSFENNEQVLLSTNEKLLLDKKLLEDKILNMAKQLELTESSKKKALEELEEKNRLLLDRKLVSNRSFDTELALRAELANLRSTKNALVTSIKSISTDERELIPNRILQRNSSKNSLHSNKSSSLFMSFDDEEEDDDEASNYLSNLTEISESKISKSAHVDDAVTQNESVLKYIANSQKKSDSRPKVQKMFSSFYSYDKDDGDSSPRLQSTSSKSTTDSSIAPTSTETPIKTTESPSASSNPSPRKSLSPIAKRENRVSISSANSSVSSGSSSSSKNISSSSKNISSSSKNISSSSKNISSSSKKKNNINDRFIVPKSKLDLLLEPTTSTDRSYTTNSYVKNSYAKTNYASNNDKRK